uniref:Uncharacterized protein n=1 Tax=Arundo donax TaxID=35708 RepID=A0A0A9FGP7_ARUDO
MAVEIHWESQINKTYQGVQWRISFFRGLHRGARRRGTRC